MAITTVWSESSLAWKLYLSNGSCWEDKVFITLPPRWDSAPKWYIWGQCMTAIMAAFPYQECNTLCQAMRTSELYCIPVIDNFQFCSVVRAECSYHGLHQWSHWDCQEADKRWCKCEYTCAGITIQYNLQCVHTVESSSFRTPWDLPIHQYRD